MFAVKSGANIPLCELATLCLFKVPSSSSFFVFLFAVCFITFIFAISSTHFQLLLFLLFCSSSYGSGQCALLHHFVCLFVSSSLSNFFSWLVCFIIIILSNVVCLFAGLFLVRLFIIISLSSCFCSCPSYGLGQCALLHQADK